MEAGEDGRALQGRQTPLAFVVLRAPVPSPTGFLGLKETSALRSPISEIQKHSDDLEEAFVWQGLVHLLQQRVQCALKQQRNE